MDMDNNRAVTVGVIVAALGYFVDVYDLVLFSVVRVASLRSLGVPESELLPVGVLLLNMQMGGLLVGGVLWGILGDKKGRISVLFGSIFLYSVANIANGFVETVEAYAAWRFVAGVGLAGELGVGITLVAELMKPETRGYGTTIVATVGVAGAIVAGLVGELFPWNISYFIGGGMGLCLLVLRVAVHESGMFQSVLQKSDISRGSISLLFSNKERAYRYLKCILCGLPVWYVVGILITFSPEIGRALNISEIPKAGTAIMYCYAGFVLGDLCSGLLSQLARSRKKIILLFLCLLTVTCGVYLNSFNVDISTFYLLCIPIGFAGGYWAVFVTSAAEQFGTNLRATVTTTVPNFVRGATVLLTMLLQALSAPLGILNSATFVGGLTILIALLAAVRLKESYGVDLNFVEK